MENILELINIIGSITSIILGIISIVLSLYFYGKSKEESQESYKLSKDIEGNVAKLEVIFNEMYAGTFSMMKDSYEKMSSYVYQNKENNFNQRFNKEIEAAKKKIIEQTAEVVNDGALKEQDLISKFNEMLESTKEAEKRIFSKYMREKIIKFLMLKKQIEYKELEAYLKEDISRFDNINLFRELEKMVDENIIYDPFENMYIDDNKRYEKVIRHNAKIKLKNK